MVIQKVINNNVISAYDVNQQEIVIMGKGIGFKAHTGELIDESKIEKVFRIENENLSRQFQELLENIPLEHMQLTSDIISYAIKNLNVQLNQNIREFDTLKSKKVPQSLEIGLFFCQIFIFII